jgi:hypothetical protein
MYRLRETILSALLSIHRLEHGILEAGRQHPNSLGDWGDERASHCN